jgi:hypothetical protein
MGGMFNNLPIKVFPHMQNQCFTWKITNFQQQKGESIPEAWEHLQEYISDSPHHGIKEWMLLQSFNHGLNQKASEHLDAAGKGSFLSLTTRQANTLM